MTVAVAPDGQRVFVAGDVGTAGPAIEVAALAPLTGQKLWTTRVQGARTGLGNRYTLTVTPDGSRLLLMATDAADDFLVVALDPASGDAQWSTTYDGPAGGSDYPLDLAVSPGSDEIYVTGRSEARGGDLALVALAAADGALRWSVRYAGPSTSWGGWDTGYSVEVSPDGSRVFVAGRSAGNSSVDLMTLAYDVPGESEAAGSTWTWVRRYTPIKNSGLGSRVGLDVSEDGSRVVTSGEGFNNFWTIAYDAADGEKLWTNELHGTELSNGWASSLDETKVEISGERVFLAISKAWDPGPLLASYDLATGAQRWTTRYLSGPPLETSAMTLSPDGDTIYTLASTLDASYGASVAAFDAASGAQQWVGRMNSATEHIFGNALAISPSGDALFATGSIRPLDYDGTLQNGTEDIFTWSYET